MRNPRDGHPGSFAHAARALRITRREISQTTLQPHRVKRTNRKQPHAAESASRLTHQPIPALTRSLSHGGVHDLDQLTVAGFSHAFRILLTPICPRRSLRPTPTGSCIRPVAR